MSSHYPDPQPSPSPDEVAELKRLAAGIIRSQGNRFIKELLRSEGIRIGNTKDEFERNLIQAIENGKLRLGAVDNWLKRVEGWGNQHVYLFELSDSLLEDLTENKIRQRVRDAGLEGVWDAPTVMEYPDEPKLTSISFRGQVLSLIWQEASPAWTPVPEKNYPKVEGLDTFEYRAYRKVEKRAITRFEIHSDKGLGALFISDPIQGEEHEKAVAEAKEVISKLLDLPELESGHLDIADVSKNMDQRNVPTNIRPNPDVKTQKSRLKSGGSYVEFAADSRDKAYWQEPAILKVRESVRDAQLVSFHGTGGVFLFQPGLGALTRPLRVQLYEKGDRIRLWAQMEVDEVWTILSHVNTYQ